LVQRPPFGLKMYCIQTICFKAQSKPLALELGQLPTP
jgi:hypothetical protein